jgi:hypothetical protein
MIVSGGQSLLRSYTKTAFLKWVLLLVLGQRKNLCAQ